MSNPFLLGKSSNMLPGQQCGGFQDEFSGSSAGISGSSSGASSSNAQQASVGLANKTNGNSPDAVEGAGAFVDLNCSIQTANSYYRKEDGDVKMWRNKTVQSEENASKLNATKWFSIRTETRSKPAFWQLKATLQESK